MITFLGKNGAFVCHQINVMVTAETWNIQKTDANFSHFKATREVAS